VFIQWNSHLAGKSRQQAFAVDANFPQQISISKTSVSADWYPWTNQTPGIAAGLISLGSPASPSGQDACHNIGWLPFLGAAIGSSSWHKMKKCLDNSLVDIGILAFEAGYTLSNIPDVIYKHGGVCYYLAGFYTGSKPGTVLDHEATEKLANCSDCEPLCYALIDCTGAKAEIHTNDNLAAHLGNIVTISGEGSTCWQVVTLSPPCTSVVSVTVLTSSASCYACSPACCSCGTCSWDETNAKLVVDIQQCDCPVDFTGTLIKLAGTIDFNRCSDGGFSYFEGFVTQTLETYDNTTCDGDLLGSSESQVYLKIRYDCTNNQWAWTIGTIWLTRQGTCDGWTFKSGCGSPNEDVTLTGNTLCP
jgi:hypothetical protein